MVTEAVPTPPRPTLPVADSVARFPVRRIWCVGRNYLEHIREFGNDEREPPFFFGKPADAVVGDGAVVPYPPLTENLHFEVELVVAIGKGGRNVPEDDALSLVFGYAIGIDLTRRDLQRAAQEKKRPWEIGKAFDFSAPCGLIHAKRDIGHVLKGPIRLSVNGEVKQDADLSQMIWDVPEIISKLSQQVGLEPGDLILTGTPAGVGPVVPGDVLEATCANLTPLRITIGERLR